MAEALGSGQGFWGFQIMGGLGGRLPTTTEKTLDWFSDE